MKEKKVKARKHSVLKHPILGGLLTIVWGYFIYMIVFAGTGVVLENALHLSDAVSTLFAALGGFVAILIHKAWFKSEFAGCFSFSCFKDKQVVRAIIIYLVVDFIICLAGIIREGFTPSLMALYVPLMAGFGEEATFRVLPVSTMMRSYKDKNYYWPALIVPAVCFGLVHLLNIIGGAGVDITIFQVITAMTTGLFLGAIYLRTGSIVMPIMLHYLHDFMSMLMAAQSTGILNYTITINDYVENGIIMALEIVLTVLLLKGHKEDVMNTWQNIWHVNQAEA